MTDKAVLDAAEEKLMQLKKNIRALDYNAPYATMISGEATVGYMFTQHVLYTLQERPDMVVVYPEEGMGFGIDCCVIPANAPHPDNAHLFLNFLLRPEIGAQIAQVQLMQNCNKAADALLGDDFKNNPVLYIPDEVLGDAEFIEDVAMRSYITTISGPGLNSIKKRPKQEGICSKQFFLVLCRDWRSFCPFPPPAIWCCFSG